MKGNGKRILVAMSGGVDSSVAAALLLEQGYQVVGVTMKTFCYAEVPSQGRTCCGLEGISDARSVADRLGVPHYVFDVEEAFTRDVIDDFVSEYSRGRTPNPCVRCNANTKFRDLFRRGDALGCEGVASGHYVRIRHGSGSSALLRGLDARKDQAYFLWGLPAGLLSRLHFPLGELDKAEVRSRARALGLSTADKPESQEICFVPTGNYRDLLAHRLAPRHPALEPGTVVDLEGHVLGEHAGYASFTVGQRRGLGGGFPEPYYVVEIRADTREVVVGPKESLDAGGAEVCELNWLTHPTLPGGIADRSAPLPGGSRGHAHRKSARRGSRRHVADRLRDSPEGRDPRPIGRALPGEAGHRGRQDLTCAPARSPGAVTPVGSKARSGSLHTSRPARVGQRMRWASSNQPRSRASLASTSSRSALDLSPSTVTTLGRSDGSEVQRKMMRPGAGRPPSAVVAKGSHRLKSASRMFLPMLRPPS